MSETVDVVVVGMGPGGEAVAGQLAEAGLSVIGIDEHLVGGECPYYGCVPSKMLIRAANSLAEARRVAELAGTAEVVADFAPVAARIRAEATDNWEDQAAVDRFQGKGGRFVRGHARLTGPNSVAVGEREFTVRRAIVLNPGADPVIPPIPGLADTPYWTNRDVVTVTESPTSMTVIGGGAVGVELAQAFARFGTRVVVVESASRLLAAEEPEAGALIGQVLRAEGLDVRVDSTLRGVGFTDGAFTIDLGDNTVRSERLLVAAGRRNRLADLGLQHLGIEADVRALDPDDRMRIAEGVYAIGDVTSKGAFTHISMYQAGIVVGAILGRQGPAADYRAVPRVTFTDPEVGSVGLTESQARDRGIAVRVGRAELSASSRGWIHKSGNQGLIKLVADADRGILVGATSVGPCGGEVLAALTVAVHARVPITELDAMIWAYPTFHRAVEDAVAQLI